MPLRPGYGTQGRPILLLANYFELVTPPELILSQHSIEVLPDAAGKKPTGKHLKRIVELLLQEHVSPNRSDIATDYKSFLLSRSSSIIEDKEYRIRYLSEGEDEPSPNARSYRMRLKFTRTLQMSELIDYVTSSNARELFDSKEDMIQALNVVLGHYPKTASSIVSVGANKHFDGTDKLSLGGGLTAVRGLFLSVRAATSRLLVNVQVKHAAFYSEVPLGALMSEYGMNNVIRLGIFLKRLRIRVTHITNRNKRGQVIPRVKTITSLASPQDGRSSDHPPIVPRLAAGAKEVMFYLGSPAAQTNIQGPAKPTKKSGQAPWGGSAAPNDG
jgi:eukaryotic translation initiation factor 2C